MTKITQNLKDKINQKKPNLYSHCVPNETHIRINLHDIGRSLKLGKTCISTGLFHITGWLQSSGNTNLEHK